MLYCAMIGLAATAVVIGHCQAQQSVGNSTELVQTPSAPAKPAQRSSPVGENPWNHAPVGRLGQFG